MGMEPKRCQLCWWSLEPCDDCRKAHKRERARERRRTHDELMRSCGLTKVKGAVTGRTYWE